MTDYPPALPVDVCPIVRPSHWDGRVCGAAVGLDAAPDDGAARGKQELACGSSHRPDVCCAILSGAGGWAVGMYVTMSFFPKHAKVYVLISNGYSCALAPNLLIGLCSKKRVPYQVTNMPNYVLISNG